MFLPRFLSADVQFFIGTHVLLSRHNTEAVCATLRFRRAHITRSAFVFRGSRAQTKKKLVAFLPTFIIQRQLQWLTDLTGKSWRSFDFYLGNHPPVAMAKWVFFEFVFPNISIRFRSSLMFFFNVPWKLYCVLNSTQTWAFASTIRSTALISRATSVTNV